MVRVFAAFAAIAFLVHASVASADEFGTKDQHTDVRENPPEAVLQIKTQRRHFPHVP